MPISLRQSVLSANAALATVVHAAMTLSKVIKLLTRSLQKKKEKKAANTAKSSGQHKLAQIGLH